MVVAAVVLGTCECVGGGGGGVVVLGTCECVGGGGEWWFWARVSVGGGEESGGSGHV